jgi:hypothetical protein
MKNIIAMAVAFTLVMSEQYRNRVIKHINACEEDDTYKSYIKYTKEKLQDAIYNWVGGDIKVDEFDGEFEMMLYQALQKGLEQFGIYTRADGDRLIVKQSIVELS